MGTICSLSAALSCNIAYRFPIYEMEHLDLAGYLGHAPQSWNTLGTFQEQDAVYLSSSRQMLEPILEETSEDEERARSSFIVSLDHRSTLWSSTESETGSVLRIETIKDVDAVSERDFVCPPKRPRRSHDLNSGQIPEDCVQLRRPMSYDPEYHNSFERFLALEACARDSFGSQGQRSSIGSRRGGTFDDFYSDRDSAHSLSRSSSLVQFESLERQLTLQEQHQSMNSLGNSSPSLTCESGAATRARTRDSSPDSRKGSAPTLSLLKRYESSDCSRLHQTYYELNNLNFEYKQQQELLSRSLRETKLKSEGSSSSSSSSDSSGHSLLSSCLVPDGAVATEGGKQDGVSSRRIPPNSAENLSEDSGYCEPRTLKREKSKSIPKNFDKLCEEEEELLLLEEGAPHSRDFKDEHDLCQTEIEQTADTAALACSPSSINSSPERASSESESASPLPSPTGSASTSSAASFTWLHNSLPDIREPRGPLSGGINNSKPKTNGSVLATTRKNSGSTRSSSSADSCDGLSLLGPTHSLNELQVLERRRRPRQIRPSQRNSHSNSSSEELEELDNFFVACHTPPMIRRSFSWNERARKVVGVASAGYLNASYQNLTLLNYTDNWLPAELLQKNHKRSPAEEMSKQSSKTCGNYEHMICKGNFLLDEISKVYDKNVSILTDKPVLDTKLSAPEECDLNAPIECSKVQHVQLNIKPPPRQKRLTQQPPAAITFNGLVKTFDQDPTNLRTSYTQSLERCHLDEQETAKPASYPPSVISQRFLPKRRFQSQTSAAMQRSLVSSTPNLAASDDGQPESEYDIYVSSAHASMHQLPQTTTLPKPLGILLPAGSRHSFGKEVSFCPVVSKYCWQEQSSEEPTEDHFHSSEGEQGPPSDDEQMDPTLVHNTRENENIVALFEPEPEHHLREPTIAQKFTGFNTKALFSASAHAEKKSSCEESANVKNKANLATPDCRDQRTEAKTTLEPEPALSSTVSLKPCAVANSSCREETPSDVTEEPASATARPLSLPILSEPPTNRAHHILYSSQQLRRYEPKASPINKMPPAQELSGQAAAVVRTDEKHPTSRSLFSRFTHGLRFSLRRKKKQQQQEPSQVKASPGKEFRQSPERGQSVDFVHIPLKPQRSLQCGRLDDTVVTETSSGNVHSLQQQEQLGKTSTLQRVTGKPPLPKMPPRSGILTHAPQETTGETVSCHRTEALPSVEREHCNQLTGQLMDKVRATRMRDTGLSSQTEVAQETHTVNRLTGHGNATRPTVVTAVPVSVAPVEEVDKMGLIETNLDTHETVISGKTRSLMDITYNPLSVPHKRYIVKRLNVNSVAYDVDELDGKVKPSPGGMASVRRPHKSMEFLLDKENQKNVLPPENELQKSHDHNPGALSEHQLRVQASLQRLNIPDWFRHYSKGPEKAADGENACTSAAGGGYRPGNFTRKRTQESGRWQALNSKTTSLSSLGSQRSDRSPLLMSPSAHSHHGGQSSYSCGSTTIHGPAPVQIGMGATRWSTSHLNSTQMSPGASQRGSFTRGAPINSSFMSVASGSGLLRNSYRQPYLGWRSTEKLSQRTPHERLANSLLSQRTTPPSTRADNETRALHSVSTEIQSSIKEVTSAIVHFVNDQQQSQHPRSRSTSPNSRCWLESSFVGTRTLDSPQTPVIDNSPPELARKQQQLHPHQVHLDVGLSPAVSAGQLPHRMNGMNRIGNGGVPTRNIAPERSLSSASLEDVLASLLGLPTAFLSGQNSNSYSSYTPNAATTAGAASRQQLEVQSAAEQQRLRRRSEGDAPTQEKQYSKEQPHTSNSHSVEAVDSAQPNNPKESRRASLGDPDFAATRSETGSGQLQLIEGPKTGFGSGQHVRCRNSKCDQSTSPSDAKKLYKSCHNCSHLYCSRECRRAHWEKHRKACLHSRASNICRQVLATCKDDIDSQRHLSLLARKGSLSQGRGVVRVLFRSAEAAEGFIKNGFQCMGEASYVRWPDLMPAEMGLELYSELLKLSTEYKPETKMLIYVAICVVSEAPGMGQAPVRWERQLVSRCAKLKLCKTVLAELEQHQAALLQPVSVVPVPERTEILILTFNPGQHSNRELILSNILEILIRRGVMLSKHYPEVFERLQTYSEGQSDKFNPVTLHPRDTQTGQNFVCIIMAVHTDNELTKLPSAADGGNRVTTIDVGSPAALVQLELGDDQIFKTKSRDS
ncbi:uncharacterized protein LOC117135175 isoform X1 [Drosophila mauritiana]|uniref:Uncharacterized protein LOC117135175 isoform X1 n=1 Tax=Drosophila mauritiana TaxID=7226 RepID=A0A6P8J6H2_DROMA|nr:uncharacterized protein LOC117135175 isoform X1 [Drosophila mauritiana]XP_033151143.1 uncharacterized protein LOC117135175 isoform X1 [Drosophila mauritiana]XP_033151151.1 uncharacterized protein LOC117135175 isoform X1 [Drosophila mauritiana]XP_033151160.1 uncharacterized protein LOC117135175 isoform X1 [Drosophila mauritiana]XP_033151169.1 uncharacterized protein LOC117135175 isoform X1 [Drosophila mauritiana]XP_033151178.1 uncharacterized protein LOC117135175 isoform X1 [Drosophila mauri